MGDVFSESSGGEGSSARKRVLATDEEVLANATEDTRRKRARVGSITEARRPLIQTTSQSGLLTQDLANLPLGPPSDPPAMTEAHRHLIRTASQSNSLPQNLASSPPGPSSDLSNMTEAHRHLIRTTSQSSLRTHDLASSPSRLSSDHSFSITQTIPPISSTSSFSVASATSSRPLFPSSPRIARSYSMTSIKSESGSRQLPKPSECSTLYNLRDTRTAYDYSQTTLDAGEEVSGIPLTCSPDNILLFSRGNRVHYKSLYSAEDIGQLCKLKEKQGKLTLLAAAGTDNAHVVALGTSSNCIALWDVTAKREVVSWVSKDVTTLAWNGHVLVAGSRKGSIRSYDTRVRPGSAAKMKDKTAKSVRHQSKISALAWSTDRRYLGSAEENGTVYVWEPRSKRPLNVGEPVQRRKKIQHEAAVNALSWCSYSPSVFATGDYNGVLRLWNVDTNEHSNVIPPGHVDTGAPINNIVFSSSSDCKEILCVQGPKPGLPADSNAWAKEQGNCLVAYRFPGLQHVTTEVVSNSRSVDVGGAVCLPGGTKIVVALPSENKLRLWDVWGKPQKLAVKRQASFVGTLR